MGATSSLEAPNSARLAAGPMPVRDGTDALHSLTATRPARRPACCGLAAPSATAPAERPGDRLGLAAAASPSPPPRGPSAAAARSCSRARPAAPSASSRRLGVRPGEDPQGQALGDRRAAPRPATTAASRSAPRSRVPRNAKVARVQATSTSGATGSATAPGLQPGRERLRRPAAAGDTELDTERQAPAAPRYTASAPPSSGNPDCPLAQPELRHLGLTLPTSCTEVASDTASNPNPLPFWGKIDCARLLAPPAGHLGRRHPPDRPRHLAGQRLLPPD